MATLVHLSFKRLFHPSITTAVRSNNTTRSTNPYVPMNDCATTQLQLLFPFHTLQQVQFSLDCFSTESPKKIRSRRIYNGTPLENPICVQHGHSTNYNIFVKNVDLHAASIVVDTSCSQGRRIAAKQHYLIKPERGEDIYYTSAMMR